jgi:hypothetical protein
VTLGGYDRTVVATNVLGALAPGQSRFGRLDISNLLVGVGERMVDRGEVLLNANLDFAPNPAVRATSEMLIAPDGAVP